MGGCPRASNVTDDLLHALRYQEVPMTPGGQPKRFLKEQRTLRLARIYGARARRIKRIRSERERIRARKRRNRH